MNSVSWFFYFIGFVSKLQIFLLVMFVAATLTVIFSIITACSCYGDSAKERKAWHSRRAKLAAGAAVFFMAVATLIPGQTTLYAIAASQIGERIAQTPAANEIASDANEILRGYLKKLKDGLKEDSK